MIEFTEEQIKEVTEKTRILIERRHQQTQKVREILMKYTAPLGKYDGFNAWTIAEMIMDTLNLEEST